MLLENCSPHVHSICPCITNDSVLGIALLVLLCHCMFLVFYLANFRVIMRICIPHYLYAIVWGAIVWAFDDGVLGIASVIL